MKSAFWRLAHMHYQGRKPMLITEIAAFTWFTFFALVYGSALVAGWAPMALETLIGILLVGIPLVVGVLHRRIRIEACKAPDALYRKRIETNR
jgi:hypothetical protein